MMHLTAYAIKGILLDVIWTVEIGDEFETEFNDLHEDVQMEILASPVFCNNSGRS